MTEPIDAKAARIAGRTAKRQALNDAKAAFESQPEEERLAQEQRLAELLESAAWQFARTMPWPLPGNSTVKS